MRGDKSVFITFPDLFTKTGRHAGKLQTPAQVSTENEKLSVLENKIFR